MINLTRKMKKEDGGNHTKRAFIRDKLLLREVQEMEQNLPKGMACIFTLSQLLTLSPSRLPGEIPGPQYPARVRPDHTAR